MKIDDSLFLKIAGFVLSVVSFGAISAHKITEHGREINAIKNKLDPPDGKNMLMTAEMVEHELCARDKLHKVISYQISQDIQEIKETLKDGEQIRNHERAIYGAGMEDLKKSIERLAEKLDN